MKRREAGSIGQQDVGGTVLLKGWIHRRRDHGGVIFLDLRDRSGIVQIVVKPEDSASASEALAPARMEWVIEVEGQVLERSEATINDNMPTGRWEVSASSAKVLARCEPLPFGVEGGEEAASEDTRLTYRFIDLRREPLQNNLALRSETTLEALAYFREHGFYNVETPILTRSTPEGARDYLVPSRVSKGAFFALPQSPQLFKQILQVAGIERYVQIARCFRDEDLRADRQPEFTQIDVEMSFVDEDDVFEISEGLLRRLFGLVNIEVPAEVPRMTYDEAMARFGTDRPDLRVSLEITELTDLLQETEFRGFQATVESGGVIRAVRVPGAAGLSRKQVDGCADIARQHGALGVLTFKHTEEGRQFLVKTALSREQVDACCDRLELEEGDLALVVAAQAPTASAALGALRVEMGRQFGCMREDAHEFLWVTDFPLFDYDEEAERWDAVHHPFTSPRPEDLDRLEQDPGSLKSRAYDIVLNGNEIGGGSIRIHDADVQNRVLGLLGITSEEAEERFGFMLKALRYGAPPHGGIAFGLDRIVMLMAGAKSLRDVIAFPKTASATCLMTEAPSSVESAQLQDLGIRVARPAIATADDSAE